jgi:hypothetical protein
MDMVGVVPFESALLSSSAVGIEHPLVPNEIGPADLRLIGKEYMIDQPPRDFVLVRIADEKPGIQRPAFVVIVVSRIEDSQIPTSPWARVEPVSS